MITAAVVIAAVVIAIGALMSGYTGFSAGKGRPHGTSVVQPSNTGGIPRGFAPCILGLEHLKPLMDQLSAHELVVTLGRDRALCDQVMAQSDKRYQPSTFIEEVDGTFRVGWYHDGYQNVRVFARRELALADYLLFSFGKGRL